ncbi:uncharacterized protein LOC131423344 [Marmota monax]|uniref:uncharacterized protein LOC131423344 n=1 Tax=Marmota monax TaxID=9995 RepID=UPI0026EF1AEA|nr:uncharacterized protein LOC131423344 [Marmota monax]
MRIFTLLRALVLVLVPMAQTTPMQWWAVARAWPMPMPVHGSSSVLPTLFSTSCEMSAPCASPRGDVESIFNQSQVNLTGVFCFSLGNANCISLKTKNLTNWEDPLRSNQVSGSIINAVLSQVVSGKQLGSGTPVNSSAFNITTLAMISKVLIPVPPSSNSTYNATHFKASPYCTPNLGFPPTFTPCQDHSWERLQVAKGFSFSPSLKRYGYNFNHSANSSTGVGWSWFQWLIFNEKGASADISALAQLLGVRSWLANVSGTVRESERGNRLTSVSFNSLLYNATLPPAMVCVQSPFLLLLTNDTSSGMLDCSSVTCLLSECWNGSWTVAVVMKIPTFVPIPVTADPDKFPIVELLRVRRDFGITAAIVTAVAVSAAAAVTAGVAMASQVQTAATINQVVQQTSTILESQNSINQHILSGILAANQRIDLLQAQVEELADLVLLGCVDQRAHLCITSVRFNDSRNASRIIGEYLSGTWSMEAENLIQSQLTQIAVLNSTRVEPVTLGQFTDWISSAFSFFKEWVGVGIFGAMCCFSVVLCLWLLCRLKTRHAQEKAMIIQALAALENGNSPQVWLAHLKQ